MAVFIHFAETVFGGAWKLFNLNVPGFAFSYADIILAMLLASGGWLLLKIALGFGVGMASKGKSTRNPKISKERKGDEK